MKLRTPIGLDADPDVLATAATLAAGIGYNLSISIKLKEKDKEVNISNIQYNRIYTLGYRENPFLQIRFCFVQIFCIQIFIFIDDPYILVIVVLKFLVFKGFNYQGFKRKKP